MDILTGWTAFLGATSFEFGALCAILEAWNRSDTVNFGWAVEGLLQPNGPKGREVTRNDDNRDVERDTPTNADEKQDNPAQKQKWIWFSLSPKYFRELGFLAALIQWLGATIFWISG